jgi:hypothetical protein
MIVVFLKDGITVYRFEDAADLRKLLHERPAHKPEGGKAVEVDTAFRTREDPGKLVDAGKTKVRYISRPSISHVIEL